MKIKEIWLPAYGCFTDYSLEFKEDKPFCLVYGNNESGKTTLLNSLLDFFYGIPKDTPYAYKHGTPMVGATIILPDGQTVSYQKKKGGRKLIASLDNDEDICISADSLRETLPKDVFINMFGLDHQTLRDGGKALAEGKGQVAESIFISASGINNLQSILQNLNKKLDVLYRPRGKNQVINSLLSQYKIEKQRVRELSSRLEEFEKLQDDFSNKGQQLNAIQEEIKTLRLKLTRLERIKFLLPRTNQYQDAIKTREMIGKVPYLPPSARNDRIEALKGLESTNRLLVNIKSQIEDKENSVQSYNIPDNILNNGVLIDELYLELSRYRNNYAELPETEVKIEDLEKKVLNLAQSIDPSIHQLNDISRLRLPVTVQSQIKELCRERPLLLESLMQIEKQVEENQALLYELNIDLSSTPIQKDVSDLEEMVDRVRDMGDLEKILQEQKETISEQIAGLQQRCQKLILLRDRDLKMLSNLRLPLSESINRWDSVLKDIMYSIGKFKDEQNKIRESLAMINDQLSQFGMKELYTENDLIKTRKKRQEGWRLIINVLNDQRDLASENEFTDGSPLEIIYQACVDETDKIADFLRNYAETKTKWESLAKSKKDQENRLVEQVNEYNSELQRLEIATKEWEQEWNGVDIEKVLSPTEMKQWLSEVEELRKDYYSTENLIIKSTALETQIKQIIESINERLVKIDLPKIDESLSFVLRKCQKIINESKDINNKRSNLLASINETTKKGDKLNGELNLAQNELISWDCKWQSATKDILEFKSFTPDNGEVLIDAINELTGLLNERDTYKLTSTGFKKYIRSFEERTTILLNKVEPEMLKLPVSQAIEELARIYKQANNDQIALSQINRQLGELKESYKMADKEMEAYQSTITNLLSSANCTTIEELIKAEENCEKAQQLDETISQLRNEIIQNLPDTKTSMAQVLVELSDVNVDNVTVEIEEGNDLLRSLDEKCTQLTKEYALTENKYMMALENTSEKAAIAAQQAEDLLAQIQRHSEEYIKLSLANKVLSKSIQLYSQQNQGRIIERAGELFSILTIGSFKGIIIDYNDDYRQIIVGVRPSGEEVKIDEMSDGTLDQLYLALRLANIEQYLLNNPPLPIIMDDLLINFDDNRALATLQILKELAKHTQILFFTHHNHLKELAISELIGSIQVYELPK